MAASAFFHRITAAHPFFLLNPIFAGYIINNPEDLILRIFKKIFYEYGSKKIEESDPLIQDLKAKLAKLPLFRDPLNSWSLKRISIEILARKLFAYMNKEELTSEKSLDLDSLQKERSKRVKEARRIIDELNIKKFPYYEDLTKEKKKISPILKTIEEKEKEIAVLNKQKQDLQELPSSEYFSEIFILQSEIIEKNLELKKLKNERDNIQRNIVLDETYLYNLDEYTRFIIQELQMVQFG
ncbi:MAG: hypothetical protein HZB76_00920 [Chlamydiae bacterium]|nr:hypothetical protein [Chlamydiota bacterium]